MAVAGDQSDHLILVAEVIGSSMLMAVHNAVFQDLRMNFLWKGIAVYYTLLDNIRTERLNFLQHSWLPLNAFLKLAPGGQIAASAAASAIAATTISALWAVKHFQKTHNVHQLLRLFIPLMPLTMEVP